MKYKLSKYAKFHNVHDVIVLYNSYLARAFQVNECVYQDLNEANKRGYIYIDENNRISGVDELIESEILVPFDHDDEQVDRLAMNKFISEHRTTHDKIGLIRELQIVLTDRCNLNCVYCSAGSNDSCRSSTLKYARIIEFMLEHLQLLENSRDADRRIVIRYFGGEPLLCKEALLDSIEYIDAQYQKKHIKRKYIINTNGVLLDRRLIENLGKYNVQVNVSMDGMDDYTNSLRLSKEGRTVFKEVENTINLLAESGIDYGVICVLNKINMEYSRELVDYWVSTLQLKQVFVERMVFSSEKDIENIHDYVESLLDIYYYGNSVGLTVLGQWAKMFRLFNGKNMKLLTCGAYGKIASLRPDGFITSCQIISQPKFATIIDYINSSYYHDSIKSQYRLEYCENCHIEGICAGSCRAEFESTYRNRLCMFNNELFRQILMHKCEPVLS